MTIFGYPFIPPRIRPRSKVGMSQILC